jgi:hypothetical protein
MNISPLLPPPAPESASSPAPYHYSFGWELSDFSSHQNTHHHFNARLQGKQIRDLRVKAAARISVPTPFSPPSRVLSDGLSTGCNGGVAGKSVSHHHRQSAWQRTDLRRGYGDSGMMETDWATGAYGDTGVAEMDGVTGGIYSGDPGVDSLHRIMHHLVSYHLIIQRITHSIFPIF